MKKVVMLVVLFVSLGLVAYGYFVSPESGPACASGFGMPDPCSCGCAVGGPRCVCDCECEPCTAQGAVSKCLTCCSQAEANTPCTPLND